MNRENRNQAYSKAKEMMIAGESWDKIMEETRLRQKDLKSSQSTEISHNFKRKSVIFYITLFQTAEYLNNINLLN